ncbi:hypothetical protein ACQX8U_14455, partial [Staphylococcus aureus]|uniref:hypothetical protein n=1 Tax=Staphylococcus aureus TaxID=1280 RepID=UPI003D1A0BD5
IHFVFDAMPNNFVYVLHSSVRCYARRITNLRSVHDIDGYAATIAFCFPNCLSESKCQILTMTVGWIK